MRDATRKAEHVAPFVTLKDAARLTGLSVTCFRRMMAAGKLPEMFKDKSWKIRRDALESIDPAAAFATKERKR